MHKKFVMMIAALAASAAPIAASAQDWSGAYGGAFVSGSVGVEDTISTVGTTAFRTLVPTIAPGSLKAETDDVGFGGVIGYNFAGQGLVFGVEGELSAANAEGAASFSGAPIPGLAPNGITTSAARELSTFGAVRGRVGVPLGEAALLYGAGGLAFGEGETRASVVANGAPTVRWDGSTSETLTGWTLAAGAEFALGERVRLRGEYAYYDLGEQTVTAAGNAAVRGVAALNGIDYVARSEFKGGLLRAGLTVKF
jgi:opacity protein-like surface antigen